MCERYLHRCREQSIAIRAYAISTYLHIGVGINVVGVHKLFAYRVVSAVRIDVVSNRCHAILQNPSLYQKIAECIARYK